MSLYVKRNKDAGSMTKVVQNNFREIAHSIQQTFNSVKENFVGTSNDINSKRAFLDHARAFFEIAVGTGNSAITLTRKLGLRVLTFVVEERNVILANRVFDVKNDNSYEVVAGSNVTVTKKLGQRVIAATSGSATVRELDGSPSVAASVIQVQNDTLIDVGAGVVTLGWMEPVTNGDPDFPEILFDDDTGDVVMSGVTS